MVRRQSFQHELAREPFRFNSWERAGKPGFPMLLPRRRSEKAQPLWFLALDNLPVHR